MVEPLGMKASFILFLVRLVALQCTEVHCTAVNCSVESTSYTCKSDGGLDIRGTRSPPSKQQVSDGIQRLENNIHFSLVECYLFSHWSK